MNNNNKSKQISYSDQEKYYLDYLIKHEKVKKSKISPLGIHHNHLDEYIRKNVAQLPPKSKILDAGCGINAWPTKLMRKKYTIKESTGKKMLLIFV